MLKQYFIRSIILFLTVNLYAQINNTDKGLDSIIALRSLSNDKSFDFETRVQYARRALDLSVKFKADSTYLKSNRNLSTIYLRHGIFDSLKKFNTINLRLAEKTKDTLAMAYARYNLGFYYDNNLKNDSAYFHYYRAIKLFRVLSNKKKEGELLLNMANMQETERDYIGSEINAINAIKLIKQFPSNDDNNFTLWSSHNLIGLISSELRLYKKSLEYHNKALSYSKRMEDNYQENLYSKSNIASVYIKKKAYSTAISKYEDILKDKNVEIRDPSTFASILSKIAYCKYLNGNSNEREIITLFNKSLRIAKKNEDLIVVMLTCQYFSEYYYSKGQRDSALHYVNRSHKIGKQINSNEAILDALLLKSKITTGESSKTFLYDYIKLNDCLVIKERSIRDKFARIDYETDEIKQENIEIVQEKNQISKQNQGLIITSVGLLITLFFLYVIKTQREKNKELQLAQQQQKANEKIYNLMLSQQDKMDEARALEKQRISQELHDGILGRLFGARLSLDSLNLSHSKNAVESRGNYISELKDIEQEIRKVSHDLNTDFIAHSGFMDLINTMVETQTLAYNLKSKINADQSINWDTISNKTKIHFYRIIQESLQNIYKHANATRVDITLEQKNNLISLSIKDDGSGFDENKIKEGIGLKNMKSRVKEINGDLKVLTKENQGTIIEIEVPN